MSGATESVELVGFLGQAASDTTTTGIVSVSSGVNNGDGGGGGHKLSLQNVLLSLALFVGINRQALK